MAGPEEALGEVPGEAGLHLSQSLEGTAGNWAGGLLPGERSRQNVKYIIEKYQWANNSVKVLPLYNLNNGNL